MARNAYASMQCVNIKLVNVPGQTPSAYVRPTRNESATLLCKHLANILLT